QGIALGEDGIELTRRLAPLVDAHVPVIAGATSIRRVGKLTTLRAGDVVADVQPSPRRAAFHRDTLREAAYTRQSSAIATASGPSIVLGSTSIRSNSTASFRSARRVRISKRKSSSISRATSLAPSHRSL